MSLRPNIPRNQRNSPSPVRRRLNDTDYKYRKVNVRKNEVRLLRLLPGVEGSIIKCELFRNSLAKSRNYTALSYTWGIQEHTKLIRLEGFEFPVTDNLEAALQRLRSDENTVILWVDAICINQDSFEERNEQVGLMRRIYKTARRVAIWLGPEGNDSRVAMDLIWKLYWNPELLAAMLEDDSLLWQFKALVLLFCRDYWDRLWVVQEVLNARKIAVYCGKDAIPWAMIEQVSLMFDYDREKILSTFHDYSHKDYGWSGIFLEGGPRKLQQDRLIPMGYGRKRSQDDTASSMLEALAFHREKLCAKPEDKVYGLLGVLSNRERERFTVNYKLSAREVFINVTRYLLEETGQLQFLCAALPREPNIHQLPTWVPDWGYRPDTFPLVFSIRDRPNFTAAGTMLADASISDDGVVLDCEGVYIDTIYDTGIPLPTTTDKEADVLTFLQWYSVLLRYKENTTQEDHEDFCRVLWLDSTRDGWTSTERMEWTYRIYGRLSKGYTSNTLVNLDKRLSFYADSYQDYMLPQFEVYKTRISTVTRGRRYIMSRTGLQGIAPHETNDGDIIVVLLGCEMPVILRKEEGAEHYTFIGECYLNSYMYGQAINDVNSGACELETFSIH